MYNDELHTGSCFVHVLLFKVLRGVSFLIVIRILLHKNIIKGVASAKYSLLFGGFLSCWLRAFTRRAGLFLAFPSCVVRKRS